MARNMGMRGTKLITGLVQPLVAITMQGGLVQLTDRLTPAEGTAPEETSAGASKREQLHGEGRHARLKVGLCTCCHWLDPV